MVIVGKFSSQVQVVDTTQSPYILIVIVTNSFDSICYLIRYCRNLVRQVISRRSKSLRSEPDY